MENQFFRCTQRAITQRRVITLGLIFIKMVLNRAQGLKDKSQEVSARKNNNRQRYNKKCRRGGRIPPPPALLGLKMPSKKVTEDKEEKLGFNLEKKRTSSRVGFKVEIDLDFAHDFALLSEEIDQAQELLLRAEKSVGKVGLKMNAPITIKITIYSQLFPMDYTALCQIGLFSQLVDFTHNLDSIYDRGCDTEIVYMDFSKAFDSVSHSKLIEKPRYAGIGGSLPAWFNNYLDGRLQRVVIIGAHSDLDRARWDDGCDWYHIRRPTELYLRALTFCYLHQWHAILCLTRYTHRSHCRRCQII